MLRCAGLLFPLAVGLACATSPLEPDELRPPPSSGWAHVGPGARPTADRQDGKVLVHFPHGACATAWLEIQVLDAASGGDRARRHWVPHPDGDRLRSGTCRFEDPARLLNETRVRCYDPAARRAPSPWVVGVAIAGSAPPGACSEAPRE